MKKLLLILSILVFLNLASPVRGFSFLEELFQTIDFENIKEEASIFSDPAFTHPTNNFSPGQTVYVKVKTVGEGEKKNQLRILDSGKKEIQKMSLARSGESPYTYTASFTAPETSGIYYVDIKIEGEGSSFASQENINVGETEGSVSVTSEAESTVIQGDGLSPTLTLESTVQPEESPKPEISPPLKEKSESFVVQIIEFFRNLFLNLSRRWVLTGWLK